MCKTLRDEVAKRDVTIEEMKGANARCFPTSLKLSTRCVAAQGSSSEVASLQEEVEAQKQKMLKVMGETLRNHPFFSMHTACSTP